jgi:hypothetical protein
MPIILTIWKVEIRRIAVPGKRDFLRPHLNGKKLM